MNAAKYREHLRAGGPVKFWLLTRVPFFMFLLFEIALAITVFKGLQFLSRLL